MFSKKIVESLEKGSFIRAMFEEGARLKKIHGEDKVFDFSIGNPDVEPPMEAKEALKRLVLEDKPGKHGYMSNAGYPDVRQKVAAYLQKETGVPLTLDHIIMVCGAGAGLNVVFKTILNPDEEVIVLAPYFVEYLSYIGNYGGKPVVVPTNPDTFQPDVNILEKYITPKTKAIIINSPNNPTGVVYSKESLAKIAELLEAKQKEFGTTIFIVSDEPYNKLIYDGVEVPAIMNLYQNTIVVNSFSKSLSLPGERIGYIAVNSAIKDVNTLIAGLTYCNRVLGFVNAPALFQKVIAEAIDSAVAVDQYKTRRDILYNHLIELGFSCIKPEGAFYLFPKALIEDDMEFTKYAAQKYNLLLVPGKGFGAPGYFRIAYCASMKTIENSLPAFKALAEDFKNK